MKKYRIFVALCLLEALFATQLGGCKTAPPKDIVPNKATNELSKAVHAEAAAPYRYDAPTHWSEDMQLHNIKIHIDAEIALPEEQTFPVYSVSRHKCLDNALRSIVETMGGEIAKVRKTGMGREEILEEIAYVARGAYAGLDEKTGQPVYGAYEGQDEQLEKLKTQLDRIEETDKWSPVHPDSYLLPMDQTFLSDGGKKLYVSGRGENVRITTFYKGYIQLEDWVLEGDAFPGELPHKLRNITLSREEAQRRAEAFMVQCGLNDYVIASLQKARILFRTYEVMTEGWQITFVRDDGLQAPIDLLRYSAGGLLSYPEEDYAASWPAEQITVFLDEFGIQSFSWMNARLVNGVMNENVQLIPFLEIQDTIRNALKFRLSWFNEEKAYADSELDVVVTQISLTRCTQRIAGEEDQAYYAPAWAVFVTTEQNLEDGIDPTILVIGALDGSFINVRG